MKRLSLALFISVLLQLACGGNTGKEDAGNPGEDAGELPDSGVDASVPDAGQTDCLPRCSNGFVCKLADFTCVECVTNSDCTDPNRPQCEPTQNLCQPDPNADAGVDDGGIPPVNDFCTGAIALSFDGGTSLRFVTDNLTARNSNARDGGVPTCSVTARQTGDDIVYSYTLSQPQDVTITVSPDAGSAYRPALYVRAPNSCASTDPMDELVCDSRVNPSPLSVTLYDQQAATYFLWLDATGGTRGVFTVDLQLSPPTPPPSNDTCASPKQWQLSATGATQTDTVNLANAHADEFGSCGPFATGKDVTYQIDVSAPGDLVLRSQPAGATGGNTVMIVRTGSCAGGTELTCVDDHINTDPEQLIIRGASGTYFVVLKTWDPVPVSVSLTASLLAPVAGDYCPSAIPVDLTSSTSASVTANLGSAWDDFNATCGGSGGGDLVYSVAVPGGRDVDVIASPPFVSLPDGGAPDPILFKKDVCAGATVGCWNNFGPGQSELLMLSATDGGSYAVIADSAFSHSGTWDVHFNSYPQAPAPLNDRCAMDAGFIDPGTPVSGTLFGAADDLFADQPDGGSHGCVNGAAPEVFFNVAPDAGTMLTATVTPTGSLSPSVVILDSCGGPVRACGAGSASTSIAPGQSYVIAVEGTGVTRGDFSLTVNTQ